MEDGLLKMGEMIRAKRGPLGLRDTAEVVGIAFSTLARAEKGKQVSLPNFAKLCQWLGVEPGVFLGFKQPPVDPLVVRLLELAFKHGWRTAMSSVRDGLRAMDLDKACPTSFARIGVRSLIRAERG